MPQTAESTDFGFSPARGDDVARRGSLTSEFPVHHLCPWQSKFCAVAETWKRSRDVQETITTPLGQCSLAAAATPALASGEFKLANFGVCPSLMGRGDL